MAAEQKCAGKGQCQECTPQVSTALTKACVHLILTLTRYFCSQCASNHYFTGKPALCVNGTKNDGVGSWLLRGECKYIGVHRFGIGIYVQNIADISITAGSFYVDFILTVFTEQRTFDSYSDAMATFEDQSERRCNPEISWAQSPHGHKLGSSRDKVPLGSGL